MADIKYVCLSDMHLGAENSLLSNLTNDSKDTDPRVASPVLVQLVECLKNLILQNESTEKPTLILNGDILELALTTDNEAAMVFERFIELILPAQGERLFKKIVFIPGNHDHHLWEAAREAQYVNFISDKDTKQSPGSLLEIPWHTTRMFNPVPRVPATFLEGIVRRYPHLSTEKIDTVYPNFGLISDDYSRCVIFSHGHFIESMYMLMSELRGLMFSHSKLPETIYKIEAENFAWIDFFWSTMGRSGDVGSDMEIVYDTLQDDKALGKLVDNLVDGLDARYDLPGFDPATNRILKWLAQVALKAVRDRERCRPEEDLSPAAEAGLKKYLEGAILDQVTQERGGNIPPHATFVFGHTHKPLQWDETYVGFHPGMRVYNSGGWVVDTTKCAPTHGGAVILVDENYDTTSLWMYTEHKTAAEYQVTVHTATHPGAPENPFYQRISGLVNADQNPWKLFSETVAAAVPKRYENLQIHIDRG